MLLLFTANVSFQGELWKKKLHQRENKNISVVHD